MPGTAPCNPADYGLASPAFCVRLEPPLRDRAWQQGKENRHSGGSWPAARSAGTESRCSNRVAFGDPDRYAAMVRADRELRLVGYEVYRFGAVELEPKCGPALVGEFFDRLFRRYGVPL